MHCVFNSRQPHGDVYATISDAVNQVSRTSHPVVPHIVNLPDHNLNMRKELGIPDDAIVLGRHGGYEQFDIQFVHNAIRNFTLNNKNIYFLFVNTKIFSDPSDKNLSNIIYLDKIYDLNDKVKFINTCDAMIWGRSDGETFGLSIGEFCVRGKPIIAIPCGFHEHVNKLKDKCIWYNNEENLTYILNNINKEFLLTKRSDGYDKYTPENVMNIFKNVFID